MRLKLLMIIVVTLHISNLLTAQNNNKLERKLDKLYQKEQFEKCEQKALDLLKRYPESAVPYYYLSKLELNEFMLANKNDFKTQFKHLKAASDYSRKLNGAYPEFSDNLKNIYKDYIVLITNNKMADLAQKSNNNYIKIFRDTLPEYYFLPRNTADTLISLNRKLPFSSADSIRTELINFASSLIGTPYHYAGVSPKTGFDCSGFVMYVYNHVGIQLPHSSQLQSQLDGVTLSAQEAKPGDIIFFGQRTKNGWKTQHAGIFMGNENGEMKVIHCSSRGVIIDGNNSSWDSYWKDRVLFIKQISATSLN